MKRLDLDDLPPKIAALLAGVATGEPVLLVEKGVVVGRLVGEASAPDSAGEAEPALTPEETAKEIFEQFRSSIEDEF